jgi:hypothetical protein
VHPSGARHGHIALTTTLALDFRRGWSYGLRHRPLVWCQVPGPTSLSDRSHSHIRRPQKFSSGSSFARRLPQGTLLRG